MLKLVVLTVFPCNHERKAVSTPIPYQPPRTFLKLHRWIAISMIILGREECGISWCQNWTLIYLIGDNQMPHMGAIYAEKLEKRQFSSWNIQYWNTNSRSKRQNLYWVLTMNEWLSEDHLVENSLRKPLNFLCTTDNLLNQLQLWWGKRRSVFASHENWRINRMKGVTKSCATKL